jgi:hypothetical protein
MATTTYEPIQTQTLSSTAGFVTFSSIPATYTDLVLVSNAKGSQNTAMQFQFNSDTASNYSLTRIYGDGSSAVSDRQSNTTSADAGDINTQWGTYIAHIQNYANTTTFKTLLNRCSISTYVFASVSLWRKTPEAINSIKVICRDGSFQIGSTFTLYGIANADIGAKATGGVITYDEDYFYHTFGASGTFTPKQSLTADYLVIAGGGSGGCYTPAVGYQPGNVGGNSSFAGSGITTVTSNGGGFGARFNSSGGGAGGSGGGGGTGSIGSGPAGTGISGQGNNGGAGRNDAAGGNWESGGGGGAGAVGFAYNVSNGGGGAGLNTNSTWASATGTGVSGYYAGGGGRGTGYTQPGGAGGIGGGGAGSSLGGNGTAGIVNTGGGGGGADQGSGASAGGGGAGGYLTSIGGSSLSLTASAYTVTVGAGGAAVGGGGTGTSGAGGSGVVIIRYLKA